MTVAERPRQAPSLALRVLRDGFIVAMTALIIVALALLPLLTPWVMHAVLDLADSATWLGMDPAAVHAASDRTVNELLFGPGTWIAPGPDGTGTFFDETEVQHLRDVRQLLWLTYVVAALAFLAVLVILERSADRDQVLGAIGLGGALVAVTVVIGAIVGVLAFDPLFELFHRVFFPQGEWAFDPGSQRLVQLYPFRFWQIMAAALGVLMVLLGVAAWLGARWVVSRHRRPAW
jgi:integral membrane protein (TIGR01906 family)